MRRLSLICLLVVLLSAAGSGATEVTFPPQRHALKVLFGEGGSDYEGDLVGTGSDLIAHMHDLGITLTRVGLGWGGQEPERGEPYVWDEYDELIYFLHRNGVEPLVVLHHAPDWARICHPTDGDADAANPHITYIGLTFPEFRFADDYAAAIEAVARRYRGVVRYYEFWNEPDGVPGPVILRDREGRAIHGRQGGDPVEYAKWLRVAHAALLRGNPDAKLAAGSLSVSDPDYLEAIYATIGPGHFEAISYHPYDPRGIEVEWVERVRRICLRYGDLSCEHWLTEYDWAPRESRSDLSAEYGAGPARQVLPSDGITLSARYPYVTQAYMHTLNDWDGDPNAPLANEGFGLLTIDLRRKPKYEEYRESLFWRRRMQARELCIEGPHAVCAGDSFVLSVAADAADAQWHLPQGWSARRVTSRSWRISTPASGGSAMPYALSAVAPGGETLTRYVELIEPLQLTDARLVFTDKAGAWVGPHLSVTLRNVADSAAECMLALRGDGWRLAEPFSGSVDAGATRVLRLPVLPPAQAVPGVTEGVLGLRVGPRTVAELPVWLAAPAAAPRVAREPKMDGSTRDWPSPKWIPISGDADPAEFAVAWSDSALFIAVKVRDGAHLQTKPAFDHWLEDCVQIAFDPANDAVRGGYYAHDDQELLLVLTKQGPQVWRYSAPHGAYGGLMSGIKVGIARGRTETVYELAMPTSELGDHGQLMGMTILVNDADPGAPRRTSSWGRGVAEGKRPARFGKVRLVR